MNIFNSMAQSPLTTFFLILSFIFLTIAVVGKSKLGFAEINPGGCGRLLAFTLGIFSLIVGLFFLIFPVEMLEVIKSSLAQQIQQSLNNLTQFKLPSSALGR